MQPKQNYFLEWERGFEEYHKATGSPGISDKQHMIFLMNMCSPALRQHLQYREFKHRGEMEAIRWEISKYIFDVVARLRCEGQGRKPGRS